MSTEPITDKAPAPAGPPPLTVKELAALLVKHYGLTEGKFDLLVEYQVAIGAVGPNPVDILPGVVVGLAKMGLVES